MDGNAKTSKSVFGSAFVESVMTPATKSPSITWAALGGSEKTCVTEVGKSVWSALSVPPAILSDCRTSAIVVSASLTDWSVQGMSCVASWSYFSGPADRR